MQATRTGRISLTTWLVLGVSAIVGIVAVAMTAIVVVRLNRQVLASAAQIRQTWATPGEVSRDPIAVYAFELATIDETWTAQVADFRIRYPNDAVYENVATAGAVAAVNRIARPPEVGAIHERIAQAWSDREAALGLLARADAPAAQRDRAAELGRSANDALRKAKNELRDLLVQRGVTAADLAIARLSG